MNLEGGFITQKNATWTGDGTAAGTQYHDMNLWSVALFYDAPLNTEKGTAFNAYAGYFHTDYGQGYLRYNGIMNPATELPRLLAGRHQPTVRGTLFQCLVPAM